MKFFAITLVFLLIQAGLYMGNHPVFHPPASQKQDIVSCYNMQTVLEYQREASRQAFAQLHPAPLQVKEPDLLGKMIQFPVAGGGDAQGYFIAAKNSSKKWLIVIQEWWGLNEQIRMEADKYYAALGDMNVLAVDMYDGKVAATPDSAMKLVRGADMNRLTAILQGAMQYAGPDAGIYSVGWCFGGMWSLQTAILAGRQGKGTVMFYGRPESNLEKLKSIQCDIIGFFGNLDRSPSPEMVVEFEKNMQAAGKSLKTYKYEAGHGFANPSNPSFNAPASQDAFDKAITFLKSH